MYSFEGTNSSGDTTVITTSNTFYFIGQASIYSQQNPYPGSEAVNAYFTVYRITSPTSAPIFFMEVLPDQRCSMSGSAYLGNNIYSINVACNGPIRPRIFCFSQTNQSSISSPTDYSLVLYDENGNITFDGTRDLLYSPAISSWTTPSTAITGTNPVDVWLNSMNTLSSSGTVPANFAAFVPCLASITAVTFYRANQSWTISSHQTGIIKANGLPTSCWVKLGAYNSPNNVGNTPESGEINSSFTTNILLIDIARYT